MFMLEIDGMAGIINVIFPQMQGIFIFAKSDKLRLLSCRVSHVLHVSSIDGVFSLDAALVYSCVPQMDFHPV